MTPVFEVYQIRAAMSALGQKRTFCDVSAMSVLPPKADMCSATAHVCFVPVAASRRAQNSEPFRSGR